LSPKIYSFDENRSLYDSESIDNGNDRHRPSQRYKLELTEKLRYRGCCHPQNQKQNNTYSHIDYEYSIVIRIRGCIFADQRIRESTVYKAIGDSDKNQDNTDQSVFLRRKKPSENQSDNKRDTLIGNIISKTPSDTLDCLGA